MTANNAFALPAASLAANAVAFIAANKASDNASTPFARSALATIVGGIASLTMVETVTIAAMGSPKSPKTGKPVAKVSGLRDFDGGARLYQAWKSISDIVANLDSDQPAPLAIDGAEPVTVGDGAIRRLVEGFILETDGAPKALFGPTGLHAAVKAAMVAHGKAVAAALGVESESESDNGDNTDASDAKPVSLSDRIAALAVALNSASDADFLSIGDAMQSLVDQYDARLNAITDATAPDAAEPVAVAA